MGEPLKLRFVHQTTGAFVLLIGAALIASVILAGKSQGWFEAKYDVRIRLPAEGLFGLQRGAEVQILQTPVGVVDSITVRDDGSVEGVLRIRGDFTRFVRADSVAMIRKKFAVAGDAYVEITRGTGDALPEEGAYIECRTDTDLIQQFQGTLEDLRFSVLDAMERAKALVDQHRKLAAGLSDPDGELQQLLSRLRAVVEGLDEGEGTVGRLLRDDAVAEELEASLSTLNTALVQAQRTLEEAERLVQGLQRHILVRGFVPDVKDVTGPLPLGPAGSAP